MYKLFCTLFIFYFLSLSAQEKDSYAVSFSTFYGEGVGNIKGIESNHAESYKLGLSKRLHPENAEWIRLLNAESVSVNFIYSDLDGILRGYSFGKSYGLLSEADFRIAKKNNFKLFFTPGFGLTYVSKTVFTDPQTYIFGSHLNAILSASIKTEFQFYEDCSLITSLGFMHYSNGSTRIPNAGINIVNVGFGIKKDFELKKSNSDNSPEKSMKKNAVEISVGAGERGKYKMKDGFFKMGFYAGYHHFFNNTIAFRSGLDAVYYVQVFNPSVYDDTVPYWGKSYEHFRLGASAGVEVKMNKFAVAGNMGRYLYMESPYHQKMYWNASLKYYLSRKFGIQATLNAHKFQADFINWGLFCRL